MRKLYTKTTYPFKKNPGLHFLHKDVQLFYPDRVICIGTTNYLVHWKFEVTDLLQYLLRTRYLVEFHTVINIATKWRFKRNINLITFFVKPPISNIVII